jgi:hypothetical protein
LSDMLEKFLDGRRAPIEIGAEQGVRHCHGSCFGDSWYFDQALQITCRSHPMVSFR